MTNSRIQPANRFRPALGYDSRNREIRRHAERRRAAADAGARGQAGARLVPQRLRGRGPRSACRCARLDVRPAQGPRHVEAADRARLASRHPADRRQVRRRARHAGGARSGPHAQRCRDRDRNADLHRQLDQRGRLALRAGDDGVGRLCRRFHHRRYPVAQGCRGRHGGARRSTASAIAATSPVGHAEIHQLRRTAHRAGPDPGSRKQDHRRGRFRPGRAVVRRQDHRLRKPCRLDADAAAPRRAGDACRKSCWRWNASPESTARRRSAPSAKP